MHPVTVPVTVCMVQSSAIHIAVHIYYLVLFVSVI
jgi:hypothetical protein